jgi:hypothetical protein
MAGWPALVSGELVQLKRGCYVAHPQIAGARRYIAQF